MRYEYQLTDEVKFAMKHGRPITEDTPVLDVKCEIVTGNKDNVLCKILPFRVTAKDIDDAFGKEVINKTAPTAESIMGGFGLMLDRENYVENVLLSKADTVLIYENMKRISDSLMLDSDTHIASLVSNDIHAELEVRGAVRVLVQNYDEGIGTEYNDVYKIPSLFPQWLLDAISDGSYQEMDNIIVDENNWFELFINDTDDRFMDSVVVDCENMSYDDIAGLMIDTVAEYRKEMLQREEPEEER